MSGVPFPNAQAMFYEQYQAVRRDEVVGVLLALFLGSFGAHHFYLRRTGLGILYCCFFWSSVPFFLGLVECFFMPGRVREFNAIQAAGIAAALGMTVPQGWGWPVNINIHVPEAAAAAPQPAAFAMPLAGPQITCTRCQRTNVMGSRFCAGCGAAL